MIYLQTYIRNTFDFSNLVQFAVKIIRFTTRISIKKEELEDKLKIIVIHYINSQIVTLTSSLWYLALQAILSWSSHITPSILSLCVAILAGATTGKDLVGSSKNFREALL